jgi:catechol 2,3-dioxygenase-like lactoylglutathione lyase family enzyme
VNTTALDHVAVATRTLTDGWDLFSGLLGGRWAYGGDSPGYWWGQVEFPAGPKVELLTPTGGPDGAFLERYLTSHGPGPHHFNFYVTDIGRTLADVRAAGIEPVGVSLANSYWKEAFLHPRDAYGIVIQVAQQFGPPPQLAAPAELPEPGPPSDLALIGHRVDDIDGAIRLFRDVLGGEVITRGAARGVPTAELSWPKGARLRLTQDAAPAGSSSRTGGGLAYLNFTRRGSGFRPDELGRASDLSKRLGLSLVLGGTATL